MDKRAQKVFDRPTLLEVSGKRALIRLMPNYLGLSRRIAFRWLSIRMNSIAPYLSGGDQNHSKTLG